MRKCLPLVRRPSNTGYGHTSKRLRDLEQKNLCCSCTKRKSSVTHTKCVNLTRTQTSFVIGATSRSFRDMYLFSKALSRAYQEPTDLSSATRSQVFMSFLIHLCSPLRCLRRSARGSDLFGAELDELFPRKIALFPPGLTPLHDPSAHKRISGRLNCKRVLSIGTRHSTNCTRATGVG